jgi:hypothetical protein
MAKTARDAAKYLADAAVKVAKTAADMERVSPGPMVKALVLRSDIMMDCVVMIIEWEKG